MIFKIVPPKKNCCGVDDMNRLILQGCWGKKPTKCHEHLEVFSHDRADDTRRNRSDVKSDDSNRIPRICLNNESFVMS